MPRVDPNQNRYTLTRPCADCPFRSDVPFELNIERAEDVAAGLLSGQSEFWCHKTVDYSESSGQIVARTRACAGARATLANEGRSTTLLQLSERIGEGTVARLDPDLPVHSSIGEWLDSKRTR